MSPDARAPSYLGLTRTGRELTDLVRTYQRGDLDALTAEVVSKDGPALRALLKAAVVTMSTEGMVRREPRVGWLRRTLGRRIPGPTGGKRD